jgi:hypothetical protein
MNHPVASPKIIVSANDRITKPENASQDKNLPGPAPKYGQDFTYGLRRPAPKGQSVGTTEAQCKEKMNILLAFFADGDDTGMTKRLFKEFQKKQSTVFYFDDPDLNKAAAAHDNIKDFISRSHGAGWPFSKMAQPGQTRIHQLLRAANWDINQISAPIDMKTPSFNKGSKMRSTGDFDNGLGVMINGIQYGYGIVTHYKHDPSIGQYAMNVKYVFYDVFGIDDEDLDQYGSQDGEGQFSWSRMGQGITGWWQLQHQFGYPPLVTRCTVNQILEAPTAW